MTKKSDYISINRASLLIDISDHTIRRWYKWWENDDFTKPEGLFLPPYFNMDRRGTKFFRKEDIHHLEKFKEQMQTTHKGAMAEFNAAYQWGARGIRALKNKGTFDEVQEKMK